MQARASLGRDSGAARALGLYVLRTLAGSRKGSSSTLGYPTGMTSGRSREPARVLAGHSRWVHRAGRPGS